MNDIQLDQLIEGTKKVGLLNVMHDLEMQIIRRVLDLNQGNRNKASAELRMNRTTLVEKLKKFGMQDYFRVEKEPIV